MGTHTVSLLGWKLQGFAQKLYNSLYKLKDDEYFILVFSDNLFLGYKQANKLPLFISLDGAKMETSHTEEDFKEYWSLIRETI